MKKIIFLALSILLLNCSSDNTDERTNSLPTLTTNSITNTTTSKIISGGNISNDGGLEIISRGICWDLNEEPTIDDNILTNGTGIGEYSIEVQELNSNTEYYIRAFATNSLGTSYGNELRFTTLKDITYEVLFFEFTPDTGNNTSRLKYDIKFINPNDISIRGFHKITTNADGLISSNIATSSSPCYEINANSSCTISFDEEDSFDIGMVNSIELVSVEYNLEN
ncbi:hypothetical protein [Lutibacter citreus]|jgi:hypothetical protein|uniref:hypothetical protein n=1 Tax=Lutibacter citreus TaxID=2138210 RepID=UPI000DBE74EF|nr:hypothetical protein [Lutibacter citreus]